MTFAVIGGGLATGAGGALVGGILGGLGAQGSSERQQGGGYWNGQIQDWFGSMDQYAGQAADAANAGGRWLDAAFDPWQQALQGGINPYTTSMIQSAQQDLIQDYANNALPRIRQSAQNAGGFGGSRQGVAEGIATEGLLESLGDVSVEMLNNAYNTNEANRIRALGMTPQMAGAATLPAEVYGSLASMYGNVGQGVLNSANAAGPGQTTLGGVLEGAGWGAEVLPGWFDDLFGGQGGGGNAAGDAYTSLATSNPSSFGWGQAFF
jgi:hypothetical protein